MGEVPILVLLWIVIRGRDKVTDHTGKYYFSVFYIEVRSLPVIASTLHGFV